MGENDCRLFAVASACFYMQWTGSLNSEYGVAPLDRSFLQKAVVTIPSKVGENRK